MAEVTLEFIAHQGERIIDELRAVRAENDAARVSLQEIKERLGLLESGYSSLSRRVDRIDGSVARIERRLELPEVEA